MQAREALRAAMAECHAFQYRPDGANDYWQTPQETAARGHGDCEDLAVFCISRAFTRCPTAAWRLVIGDVPAGRHAWVEVQEGETVLWGDPAPGYGQPIEEPQWWAWRTPLWAYRFDGERFLDKAQYAPRRDSA